MKIHDLINHFSNYVRVPIDPDDVAREIKNAGISDKISFISVDLHTLILRGALHSYVVSDGVYGEPIIHSDIYHANGLDRAWRRMVCCKELLHTLDNSVSQAAKPEDVENLISGLCSIIDSKSGPLTLESLQVWNDHLMMYYAAAILFPQAVRDLLIDPYKEGLVILEEVASRLDLPETVVALVLSDGWPNLHKALTGKK